jgi:hypothetical protein
MKRKIDFRHIAPRNGSQDDAFEEFCCQLARRDPAVPTDSEFVRFHGAGGDGGVECLWRDAAGDEYAWQAKFMFDLTKAKAALDESIATAVKIHPRLRRYAVCLPFDLTGPTGKTKKDGTPSSSQKERFDGYRGDWEAFAAAQGVPLKISLETPCTLLDRLLQFDPNGGRLSFWFDATLFGSEWFADHLSDATRSARPRYTPELRIGTPTAAVFDALGQTHRWQSLSSEKADALKEVVAKWHRSVSAKQYDQAVPAFPAPLVADGQQCLQCLNRLMQDVEASAARPVSPAGIDALGRQVSEALSLFCSIETLLAQDLDTRFGEGRADSPGFRQFQAAYQMSFPAAHLDCARDVLKGLEDVAAWFKEPTAKLPGATTLVLLGPAGAGKTHVTCDAAYLRAKDGLRTVVLFGERFSPAADPWENARQMLGLPATIGRDALLTALDAAGEASGKPLLICIDGVNETKPRTYWQTRLAEMASQVARHPWLRLCITCRSAYEASVMPRGTFEEATGAVRAVHRGFADMESTACRAFFEHYGLEPPPLPAVHEEFSNPLFLRLLCEAMKAASIHRLPSGWMGLSTVIKAFVTQKNELYALQNDQLASHRVPERALQALLSAMERRQTSALSFDDAAEAVDTSAGQAVQRSLTGPLLDWLVREGLLILDAGPDGGEQVRIAFERLGDHLLAARLLDGLGGVDAVRNAFAPGGALCAYVANEPDAMRNAGLVEALSIQVPERFGIELIDCLDESATGDNSDRRDVILRSTITALPWRDPTHLTVRTGGILHDRMTNFMEAFDAALAVGLQPSPVDALWIHDLLRQYPMASRDGFWCPYLYGSYEKRGQVHRLIHAAFATDVAAVPSSVRQRWAALLLWFCAASDLRVRDFATKALVAVTEPEPAVWARLIELAVDVNDDYVIERCLAAAYGTLLRTQNEEAVRLAAEAAHRFVFSASGHRFQNALIRDHARCILELAEHYICLPTEISRTDFLPPYESEWPLAIPPKAELDQYEGDDDQAPRLYSSCFTDDFFNYTLGRLDPYLAGELDKNVAARWVFGHATSALEYLDNPELARFDRHLWAKYGAGRGRVTWAERIGKKYQRISLARLAARLADHVTPKRDRWDPLPKRSPLSFEAGRDIDPSLLVRQSSQDDEAQCWWLPKCFQFNETGGDGKVWVSSVDDILDLAKVLAPKPGSEGRRWLLLAGYPRWSDSADKRDSGTYRIANLEILSHLVPKDDSDAFWKWLSRTHLEHGQMSAGAEFIDGYAGEYPFATVFNVYEDSYFSRGGYGADVPCRDRIVPTSNRLLLESNDSYQEGHVAYRLPARVFFAERRLRWDGGSGYADATTGRLVLCDPSLSAPGPEALVAEEDYLGEFLVRAGYDLFWTVIGEKISMEKPSASARLTFTQALRWDGHSVRKAVMHQQIE